MSGLARNASIHRRDVQLPLMPYDASLLQYVDLVLDEGSQQLERYRALVNARPGHPHSKEELS